MYTCRVRQVWRDRVGDAAQFRRRTDPDSGSRLVRARFTVFITVSGRARSRYDNPARLRRSASRWRTRLMASFPTSPSSDGPTRQPPAARTDSNGYRVVMAILWTIVIMMLCWLPGSIVQKLEDGSSWFDVPDLDKVIHAGIFVVFSILWARALSCRRRFAWVALAGFGLAIVTEFVQNLAVVVRDGNIADTLTDGAGVLVGIVLVPLVEPFARLIESRIFQRIESQPITLNETTVIVDEAPHPLN